MARVGFRSGKRMLCVGHGERCFACGGRGGVGPSSRQTTQKHDVGRCPVCRGRGRSRVVEADDE